MESNKEYSINVFKIVSFLSMNELTIPICLKDGIYKWIMSSNKLFKNKILFKKFIPDENVIYEDIINRFIDFCKTEIVVHINKIDRDFEIKSDNPYFGLFMWYSIYIISLRNQYNERNAIYDFLDFHAEESFQKDYNKLFIKLHDFYDDFCIPLNYINPLSDIGDDKLYETILQWKNSKETLIKQDENKPSSRRGRKKPKRKSIFGFVQNDKFKNATAMESFFKVLQKDFNKITGVIDTKKISYLIYWLKKEEIISFDASSEKSICILAFKEYFDIKESKSAIFKQYSILTTRGLKNEPIKLDVKDENIVFQLMRKKVIACYENTKNNKK